LQRKFLPEVRGDEQERRRKKATRAAACRYGALLYSQGRRRKKATRAASRDDEQGRRKPIKPGRASLTGVKDIKGKG
jgi:hypothetical protein